MSTGIGVIGAAMASHAYPGSIARSPDLDPRASASRGLPPATTLTDASLQSVPLMAKIPETAA